MSNLEQAAQPPRIEIEGENGFALRQLVADDAQRYFDLIDSDREHFKYGEEMTSQKYPNVETVLESLTDPGKPDKTRFGIWDGEVMVGSINLAQSRPGAVEIGYWIGGEYARNGYASKATKLIVEYAFNNLDINSIVAWVAPANEGSIRTLEKAGFQRTLGGENLFYELHKDNTTASS